MSITTNAINANKQSMNGLTEHVVNALKVRYMIQQTKFVTVRMTASRWKIFIQIAVTGTGNPTLLMIANHLPRLVVVGYC
jgi:hypothetical protein